jgi:Cu+-exporting ATPase
VPSSRHIVQIKCFHCGEDCEEDNLKFEEKNFCCQGCKTVYELINKVQLCNYYDLNSTPGVSQKEIVRKDKFAFLDNEKILSKLIHFQDKEQSHITFYLPQIHCSSCIWLLENFHKVDPGVIRSQTNFLKKELSLVFDNKTTSLRQIAEHLTKIGYEPHISLHAITGEVPKHNRKAIFKIGLAGFCFANIMMLSFPEYFSNNATEIQEFKKTFSYLNLILALPVLLYSASEFFISAFQGFRQKIVNIDAPIALAIVITFSRSLFEILSGEGAGYLDSMTGIIFFMLLGRFFQNKTYNTLTFDRDYTSYFPLGVTVIEESGLEKQISLSELETGQRIKVHSGEIIPADAILFMGKARIDYSFVSGESIPVNKGIGEIIYAGGKQLDGALELEIVKRVSQSYLTQLWNNDSFKNKSKEEKKPFADKIARGFTGILFSIAAISAVYWYFNDPSRVLNAVTSILIVACPCALLLSVTFTNGNMLRILQRYGFYARNASVLQNISRSTHIVFDKTGTITQQNKMELTYSGSKLTDEDKQVIRSLANQSNHPLSKAIVNYLPLTKTLMVHDFKEIKGKGASGTINGTKIILGSASFLFPDQDSLKDETSVYIQFDKEVIGCFKFKPTYRSGIKKVFSDLRSQFRLSLISGDNNSERNKLKEYFGTAENLFFNQGPQQKLDYIKHHQSKGENLIMIGDGLNDAGALQESRVGIVINDNTNNFSPACDVIMEGKSFDILPQLLNYCRTYKIVILGSFIISILYNVIGLFFAVQGTLQPVIAAILMPVSSVSIIIFTTGLSTLLSYKLKTKDHENNNQS